MIRIVLIGAGGRMGEAVLRGADRDQEFQVDTCLESGDHPGLGAPCFLSPGLPAITDVWPGSVDLPAVVVDFSLPEALPETSRRVRELQLPWVCGVTGVVSAESLAEAAREVPVVHAPNMSLGVNLMVALLGWLKQHLPSGFDVELVEAHHRRKADAPSGTARRLLEALTSDPPGRVVHGREGHPGARKPGEIGVHALRLGGVVGEHLVRFASEEEELFLGHRAFGRDLFARGALTAARWITSAPPGLYGMEHVLGLAEAGEESP